MPQISVIVPVYNVEKYIHRCVDSILGQSFTDFELILVDDGSPDNCGAICDEYAEKDSRVVVIHQENGGLSAARNAGIDWMFANSDSEWLTFIDSDDWVNPEYLAFLYDAVVQYHVKISLCADVRVNEVTKPAAVRQSVDLQTPTQVYLRMNNLVTAYAAGVLYHCSCFQKVRFPVGKVFEDLFTTYKIFFTVDQIAYIDTVLYYYYANENSITLEKWKPFRLQQFEAFEELRSAFRKNPVIFKAVVRSYLEALFSQYKKISNLEKVEKRKYYKYFLLIRQKLRVNVIFAHVKGYINIDKYCHLYETAFPSVMQGYWYWVAICRKFNVKK